MARILYDYVCECADVAHLIDEYFERGEAPESLWCELHRRRAPRNWGSIGVRNDDPIRKAWLSDSITHELAKQQRPIDPLAPKDKFEAKHVREATGRIYIGDDVSKLSEKGRNAIIKHGGLV